MAMFDPVINLWRSRRAATAVSFALMLPLMLSGLGLAIDYSNYRLVQSRLQTAADLAALSALGDLKAASDVKIATATDIAQQNVPSDFGTVLTAGDVTLGTYNKTDGFVAGGAEADINAVRVVTERSVERGNAAPRIFSIFISKDKLTISASAIAARPTNVAYEPPEIIVLQATAGDFNELYAYCYDPSKPGAAGRGELKLIGNNNKRGGVAGFPAAAVPADSIKEPSTANWPNCTGAGQSVSFYLRNYIMANNNPNNIWKTTRNDYYTDTVLTAGVESSELFGTGKLVETILCPTKELCTPAESGGPVGSMVTSKEAVFRNALKETNPCEPGKFMYYGWEDRPPPGGDKDYNDMRMVLRCPKSGKLGGGIPRLVG